MYWLLDYRRWDVFTMTKLLIRIRELSQLNSGYISPLPPNKMDNSKIRLLEIELKYKNKEIKILNKHIDKLNKILDKSLK